MNTTIPLKTSQYNKMKILMHEILHTTMAIKRNSPPPKEEAQLNIYRHLNETPLRFEKNRWHRSNDFIHYLNTLKQHLKTVLKQDESEI